ncbi:MAG TPA: histidine kinase [Streptosporangiaceae bacterium]|nr:histidine kinase [Streptosporangiaceae bacterium]
MVRFANVTARPDVLRIANITARAVILALVGLITFTSTWPSHTPHRGAQMTLQVAAYIIAVVLMTAWAAMEFAPKLRSACVPWILGAIALVSGAAAATKTGGNFLSLGFIAAISAGSADDPAIGWIVAGLGTLGFEALALIGGVSFAELIPPGVLLGGLLLGLTRRDHRVRAEQSAGLLAKAEQLREEQAAVATLDERTRIAREIHDVLAHSLGALALNIQAARAVLTDQHDEARAVEILDQAQRMATDGLSETRRAVHALRGETLPLPEGLAELGAAHQRRHGARVTLEVTGAPRPLPPDAGLAIIRTAQEALVNTAKHSPHQPIQIRLDYAESSISLKVVNHLAENGRGDDTTGLATVNGRYGLTGLRERLLLLDGTLSAGRAGSDWVVVAEVPQ